jgi:hypothetical protein
MDLTETVAKIVTEVTQSLEAELRAEMKSKISEIEISSDTIDSVVQSELRNKIKNLMSGPELVKVVTDQANQATALVADKIAAEAQNRVAKKILDLDLQSTLRDLVGRELSRIMQSLSFPKASIPHTSIDFTEFKINGNQIRDGIISGFNSTGIQDTATDCRLSVLDEAIVVENELIAHSAVVKTSMLVEGDLAVKGSIVLEAKSWQNFMSETAKKLATDNFDILIQGLNNHLDTSEINAKNLVIDGVTIFKEGALANSVVRSNLQQVGKLKELQTSGECLLSDSIYTTRGRLGINTTEPSNALTVWDQEVEMVAKKSSQNTAFIGSERNVTVVLGAANKNNLVLTTDGDVCVDDLVLGPIKISASAGTPGWEGSQGDLCFCSEPTGDTPTGWQCLGGARWRPFGIA